MNARLPAVQRDFSVLHGAVVDYYQSRIQRHGPTALGVDWTCEPTQQLRFVQLLKLCDFTQPFSLNDLGCGYGALPSFVKARWPRAQMDYHGIDLAPAMVAQAQRRFGEGAHTSFEVGHGCGRVADYSVASGIFNVKLDQPESLWVDFVRETLHDLHGCSRIGFAVNFMQRSLESAGNAMRPLYRTTASEWQQWCEKALGVRTEVLAGYGMREFSLLARR